MGGFPSKRRDEPQPLTNDVSPSPYRLSATSHIGYGDPPLKRENQDTYSASINVGYDYNTHVFLVLDGHGRHGKLIAKFCLECLEKAILQSLQAHDVEIMHVITDAFQTCTKELKASVKIGFRSQASGTTATVAIIHKNVLHIGFVGDSQLAMITRSESGGLNSFSLTREHRASDPDEKCR